MFSLKR